MIISFEIYGRINGFVFELYGKEKGYIFEL
jgi:hypothetical protein